MYPAHIQLNTYKNESINTWLHIHRDYIFIFENNYYLMKIFTFSDRRHNFSSIPESHPPLPCTTHLPLPYRTPQPLPILPTHPTLYHPLTPILYHPPNLTLYHPPTPILYHPPTPILHHPPTSTLYHPHTPTLYHPPTPTLYRVGVGRGSQIWCKANISSKPNYRHLVHLRQ